MTQHILPRKYIYFSKAAQLRRYITCNLLYTSVIKSSAFCTVSILIQFYTAQTLSIISSLIHAVLPYMRLLICFISVIIIIIMLKSILCYCMRDIRIFQHSIPIMYNIHYQLDSVYMSALLWMYCQKLFGSSRSTHDGAHYQYITGCHQIICTKSVVLSGVHICQT